MVALGLWHLGERVAEYIAGIRPGRCGVKSRLYHGSQRLTKGLWDDDGMIED